MDWMAQRSQHRMSRNDPFGYYAGLGVDQSATSDEIKQAFKAKVKRSHPDRNPAPDAAREFQFINEAYEVLVDTKARAKYDARSYGPPDKNAPPFAGTAEPVACAVCHRVTAQPRYVIYRRAVSAGFVTRRSAQQNVFCSECGAKCAYRASAKTWMLGWWGIPWGPIYSVQAIFSNLTGGEMPPLNNLRILARQARYFASILRTDLARAIARDALMFGYRIPKYERMLDPETCQIIGVLENLLAGTGARPREPVLKDPWGFGSKSFKAQLGAAALFAVPVAAILFAIVVWSGSTAHRHVPLTQSVAPAPAPTGRTVSAGKLTASQPPLKLNQPPVPLPVSGKIRILAGSDSNSALARLRVVSATGSPNYYLKAADWRTHVARLAFFVRSGETVAVRVPIGVYELRYAAGSTWYGEEHLFGPQTVYMRSDTQFDLRAEENKGSGLTVELGKRASGYLRETAIKPSDF